MKRNLLAICAFTLIILISSCQKQANMSPQSDLATNNLDFAKNSMDNLSAFNAKKSLDNGLVGYYPFLGNVNDGSGFGYNGTLENYNPDAVDSLGLPALTRDEFRHPHAAYRFNGLSNFIDLPNNPLLNGVADNPLYSPGKGVDQFSIYMRFKPGNTGSLMTLAQFGDNFGFFRSALSINQDNSVSFNWAFVTNSSSGFLSNSASAVSKPNAVHEDRWADVVVNFGNSKLNLYINGDLVGSTNTNFSTGAFFDNFRIAASHGTFPIWFYKGTIDEVRLYNRSLTNKEIQYLLIHKKIQ